jgi:radical S-adenosyl methionine domain-containing protein 2
MNSITVERFNLAGGEPLLYSGITELADYIRFRGSAVSIITNGYSLCEKKINLLSECGVSMIGLSVDSANASTLGKLGRHTVSKDILDPKRCIDLCRCIRKKGISLKINSVISQMNYTEDFNSFIRTAAPCKWKILKIKKFENHQFDNSSLLINDAQFGSFIGRHKTIPNVVTEPTMANAYIMVDAFGNLVDTGSHNNTPVANLLTEDFGGAFSRMEFDYDIYQARYAA